MPQSQPQVIFLDAVGTLFGVKGSVGEMYLNVTRQFGVELDSAMLNQAFYASFKAAPPMAFPDIAPSEVPQCEYAWWKAVAVDTFSRAGVYEQFTDFSAFFAQLYRYFETAQPWIIYPDTLEFLQYWRGQNVPLGVVSNFDSRIYAVLDALQLTRYFDSFTVSTEIGTAKPDPLIFRIALTQYKATPAAVWHIGDSYKEDYLGATAAGIQAFWLRR